MNTILKKCLEVSNALGSKGSDLYRTGLYINNKISEELWEISDEIEKLRKNETPGKDGVLGEIVDLFIVSLDMFNLYYLSINNNIEKEYKDIQKLETFTFKYNQKLVSIFITPENKDKHVDDTFKSLGQISRKIIEASLSVDGLSYKIFSLDELFYHLKFILSICIYMFVLMSGDVPIENIESNFVNIANKKIDKWKEKRNLK